MAVRILHAADFHLDSPYHSLTEDKARLRRQEARELLMSVAEKANSERVQLVLLAGDLFDSGAAYWETSDMLVKMLSAIRARVFIAPGNHDYWSPRSPWAQMELPENVHVFRSGQISRVDIPELGCRVFGAAFTSPVSDRLLPGFSAGRSGLVDIMVMHGEVGGDRYNPISESEIADSGLSYLALGHVHSFSGIKKAGGTHYAYPGCLEGRGFDECGEKGVIIGSVGRDGCDLDFVPMAKRRYGIVRADISGDADPVRTALSAAGGFGENDVVRVILTGETAREPDRGAVLSALEERFFAAELRDESTPAVDVWSFAGEDSLKGLFVSKLRNLWLSEADESKRERIYLAARYGVAAIDGREAWRP